MNLLSLEIGEIDVEALPRDRSNLDAEALMELRTSIALHGLRQPIEVFTAETGYVLISGLRRLTAIRQLHAETGKAHYATIPAFLRTPADLPEALAAMVEENDVRSQVSPWDQGRIAAATVADAYFPTLDAAVLALYPSANKTKRSRLRLLAELADQMEGTLTNPELLSQTQCIRIATALRAGFSDLIRAALHEQRDQSPAAQWQTLQSILVEAEEALKDPTPYAPGRPRRLVTPHAGLKIRRERTAEGWNLRFTGPEATGMMMESVLEEILRMYEPA